MAEQWPSTLQDKVNANNFNVAIGDTKIRSSVDAGPPKVRSRFTKGIDTYTVSIWANKEELEDFLEFYKITLGNGVLRFEFTNPLTDTEEEFRFVGAPAIRPVGNSGIKFEISMVWEQLP